MTDRTGAMRLGLCAVAVVAAIMASVASGNTLPEADATEPRVIRVGVYENAPKIYRDPSGKPAGLFVDLLTAIAREQGWRLQFTPCAWLQCLQDLAAGDLDLMPDMAYSEARSQVFSFHRVPVTHSWSVVLTPETSSILSLPDLKGRRIALLRGAVQTQALRTMMDSHGLAYTVSEYASYAEAFAAVRDGLTDAVVSNSYHAGFHARDYGLRETSVVFAPTTLYFAATKGDPLNLLPAIDANLEAWRYDPDSVYYASLKTSMVPAQEPVVPLAVRYTLFGAVALLVLVLSLSAFLRRQVQRKTRQLRETAQRLDHMLGSSPVVLYQLAMTDGRIDTRWVSDNVQPLFGLAPAEFVARNGWRRHLHPDDRDMVLNNLAVLPQREHLVQEYRIVDVHGKTRFVRDEMQFTAGRDGQSDEIVGSWNDLTESREQSKRLSFLTHYDPLTRLPNRALLLERLTHAIYRAQREDRPVALLYMDLDRFKAVNDSFGHNLGDNVLQAAADRLARGLRAGDLLARSGGDGFVLLIEDDGGRRGAVTRAQNLMKRFIEPIALGEHDIVLTLSVGISLYPEDGDTPDRLLQNAEAALFHAKDTGRNSYRLYSSSLSTDVAERLSMESALRGAIARNELVLHYQPQLDLDSRELLGAEALVRWQHPELGLVSPARFIPLAEEMGIVGELGAWVLKEACRQLAAWRAEGLALPRVAVNLSVQQLDAETLIPLVREVLHDTQLPPAALELEVTESMIMREPGKSTEALQGLRAMGIHLAIDDFGSGYSSLNYLKHLPLDRLKIDRSFVRDIGTDTNSQAISRAVIGLARSLELEAVAEGIEHDYQLEFLRQEGCRVGQGYLFGAPVPAQPFAAAWGRPPSN